MRIVKRPHTSFSGRAGSDLELTMFGDQERTSPDDRLRRLPTPSLQVLGWPKPESNN